MWTTGHFSWINKVTIVLCLSSQTAWPAEDPLPARRLQQRGPSTEMRLSEYADGLELDRSACGLDPGFVVITTDTVDEVGTHGVLTVGTVRQRPSPRRPDDPAPRKADTDRQHQWRVKVLQQKDRVTKLAGDIAIQDARIRALETTAVRGRDGAARRQARLAEARERRSVLAHRLATERARLGALIRDARRDGAEPGWFR